MSTQAISPPVPPASSGIEGLDEILGGGYTRDEMHLIQGTAGTGKTTLALQFLLAGVAAGESCLLISIAQSTKGLERIAHSHGWSLKGIDVQQLSPGQVAERIETQQTVLHTADVERIEITREIRQLIEARRPRRAVFDSLGALQLMVGSLQHYHCEILTLRELLAEYGCTTLFLGDRPSEQSPMGEPDTEFHALSGSAIQLDQVPPDYGETRRRLRVIKVRGLQFLTGYHNFRIVRGGLEVFPRLKGFQLPENQRFERLESGIASLDRLLGGGLEEGTTCLMTGPSGVGKSTLSSLFAQAAAKRGEHAAIFLFDERPETFKSRSAGVKIELEPYIDQGLIKIKQLDPASVTPGEFAQRVRSTMEHDHAKVIVIDSLTGYFSAMAQNEMLPTQMHDLLNFMSRGGVLSILVVSQQEFLTGNKSPGLDISYLSDTILALRLFESEGHIRRCIAAIKKRQGEHETSIRELLISPEGVRIGEPLSQYQNVLTGHPQLVYRDKS